MPSPLGGCISPPEGVATGCAPDLGRWDSATLVQLGDLGVHGDLGGVGVHGPKGPSRTPEGSGGGNTLARGIVEGGEPPHGPP